MQDKFDRSVSLLCWAFNEEESIRGYLARAAELLERCVSDYEIVLIDDGSTDRTFSIAEEFRREHPQLRIYRNPRNLNVGASSKIAIQKASKEYLFWQTIDWSYDLSGLRGHLEYLKTYDIVQGVRSRGLGGALASLGSRSDNLWRSAVSLANFLVIRALFGVPLSDFQNVTFYPTRWIQSLKLEADSSFANPEGLLKSYWNGKSIREVPVRFIPRRKGTAKGARIGAIKSSLRDIFSLWFKWIVRGGLTTARRGVIHG